MASSVACCGYATSSGSVNVDIVDASIAAVEFWRKYIYARRPVIIRGGHIDDSFHHEEWTPSALDAACGAAQVYIESRDPASKTFGTGKKSLMPLSSFLRARGDSSLYLTTQPLPEDEEGIPTALYAEPLMHMEGAFPRKPRIMGNLVLSSINLWMGRSVSSRGQSSNLHHDFHDNLYLLLRGKKIFTIAPPVEALNMYTHGSIVHVHHNGLINYATTGVTRSDSLPLHSHGLSRSEFATAGTGGKSERAGGKLSRQEQQLLQDIEQDGGDSGDEAENMWASLAADPGLGAGSRKGKDRTADIRKGAKDKRQRSKAGAAPGTGKRMKADEEDDPGAFWAWAEGLQQSKGGRGGKKGQAAHEASTMQEEEYESEEEEKAQQGPPDHFSKIPLPSLRAMAMKGCPPNASLPTVLDSVQRGPEVRKRYPRFASAAMTSFELLPGDMLYLPAGWFHEVVSVGGSGVTSASGAGGPSQLAAKGKHSATASAPGTGQRASEQVDLDSDPDLHAALNWWFYPPARTVGEPQGSSVRSAGKAAAPASAASHHAEEAFQRPYTDDRPLQLYQRAMRAHNSADVIEDNIRVVCRVRPSLGKAGKLAVDVTSTTGVEVDKQKFQYDYVASSETSQQQIFEQAAKPIADACLAGFNGTVFAYGQTGSGKTYTVHGPLDHVSSSNPQTGLMSRTLDYVFQKIRDAEAASGGKLSYSCKVNFLEIYNERVYDLLDENSGINAQTGDSLTVREHKVKGVFVEGLREEVVGSAAEAQELVVKGMKSRSVGATLMNRDSSRSHCVFTLVIESAEKQGARTKTRSAIFRLIDLAGSERQKATQAAGERLKEAGQINKSLSALCGVIQSLVEINQGAKRHVHYRDSKLTHLLKDSLGGNSRTVLIATVSPTEDCTPETLSTLRFASMAKRVRNKAVANEDSLTSVAELSRELKAAQETVKEYERQFGPLLKVVDLNGSIDGDVDMLDVGGSSSATSASVAGSSSATSAAAASALNEGAALLQAWEANFLQYVRASKGDAAVTAMRQGQIDSTVSVLSSLQVLKQMHEKVNRQGAGGTFSCVLAHAAAAYDMMVAKNTADAVLAEVDEGEKTTLASVAAAASRSRAEMATMLGKVEELKASTEAALAALQAKAAELGHSTSKQSISGDAGEDDGVEGETRSVADDAENIPAPTGGQAAEMGSSVRSTTSTTSTASAAASKFGFTSGTLQRRGSSASIVAAPVGASRIPATGAAAVRRPSVSSTGGPSTASTGTLRRGSIVGASVGNLRENTAKPAAPAPTGSKLGSTSAGSSGPSMLRRPSITGASLSSAPAAAPKATAQPKDEFLAMLDKFSKAWDEAKCSTGNAQLSEVQAELESTRAAVAATYSALASKDRTALSEAQLDSLRADFLIVKKSAWSTLSEQVRSMQEDTGKWEDMVSYLAQGPLLMQTKTELQAAKAEMETLAASKSMLSAERAGLMEQQRAQEQTIADLKVEIEDLTHKYQQAAQQEKAAHVTAFEALQTSHATELAGASRTISELQSQQRCLHSCIADKEAAVSNLQAELQQAQTQLAHVTAKLSAAEAATAAVQAQLKESEALYASLQADKEGVEATLQKARELIRVNDETVTAKEVEAAAISSELATAKATAASLQAEVASLQSSVDSLRAQLGQAELTAAEAAQLSARVTELNSALIAAQTAQTAAETRARESQEHFQQAQAKAEQAGELLASVRGEWDMEKGAWAEEKSSLAAQMDELLAQASRGSATSSAEVESLRAEISALQARAIDVEAQLREADEEARSLTSQLEAAQAASSAAQNAVMSLEAIVDQAKSEATFQGQEAEEAREKAAAAEAAVVAAGESARALKAELEATIAELQKDAASTKEQAEQAQATVAALEGALVAAKATATDVSARLAEVTTSMAAMKTGHAEALAQTEFKLQALTTSSEDINTLQSQLAEGKERVAFLEGALQEAREEAEGVKGRLMEMEAQLEDSERITRNLSEQLEEALAGKVTADVALNTSLPFLSVAPPAAKPATADTATSPVQALAAAALPVNSAAKIPASVLRPAMPSIPAPVLAAPTAMSAILASRGKKGASTAETPLATAQQAKVAGPSMQTIQEEADGFSVPCTQPVCAPTPLAQSASTGAAAHGSAVAKTAGTKRSFAAMKDGNAGTGGIASPTPITKRFHSARGLLAEVGGEENGSGAVGVGSTSAGLTASMVGGPKPLLDAAATTINVPAIDNL